jgi:hypothetical protein
MTIKEVYKNKDEEKDEKEEDEKEDGDEYNFTEKYILMIEGYSIASNIGFIKTEISFGNNEIDAIFRAYDKIGLNLYKNYNIVINEMMTTNSRLCDHDDTIKSSGFAFYTLTDKDICEFREDEERYLMSNEDIIL